MSAEATSFPGIDYVCAKCNHANVPDTRSCARCGSRLYLTCRKCHYRNPRTSTACGRCGHRLHRPLWRRWFSKFGSPRRKIRTREIILFIAVLGLIYWYIDHISSTPNSPPIPPPLKD